MGMICNYARIEKSQIEKFLSAPEKLLTESEEHIDIDRAWEPLGWMLSGRKRAEYAYELLLIKSMRKERQVKTKPTFWKRMLGNKSKEDSLADLKQAKENVNKIETEVVLIGIEGRGERIEPRIDFGYGESCILQGDELLKISDALQGDSTLSNLPDFSEMDKQNVFPGSWVQEGQELFGSYILPNFEKLAKFYKDAVSNNNTVIVWYS